MHQNSEDNFLLSEKEICDKNSRVNSDDTKGMMCLENRKYEGQALFQAWM